MSAPGDRTKLAPWQNGAAHGGDIVRCTCDHLQVKYGRYSQDCPEHRDVSVRPKKTSTRDLIMRQVRVGSPLYVELKNGSRFVGVVLDFSDELLELDVGLLAFEDIAFVSATAIPHIGLVNRILP